MPRPTNKSDLQAASKKEFSNLLNLVKTIPTKNLTNPGVCGNWSTKDILAHLHAWHKLMLTWYQVGMAGKQTQIPAPGYTWKTTPQLNEKIYQNHKSWSFAKVLSGLKKSHQQISLIIQKHSDQELFTKKKYPWTGSTSLASYLISNTSSHYNWASKLIKKWLN